MKPTEHVLRAHLASAHAVANAHLLPSGELVEVHRHEHQGPGTIRDHDPDDLFFDFTKAVMVCAEHDSDTAPPMPDGTYAKAAELAQQLLPSYLGQWVALVLVTPHTLPALVVHKENLANDLQKMNAERAEIAQHLRTVADEVLGG